MMLKALGIFLGLIILVNTVFAQRNTEQNKNRPPLVVGIVVENMRTDYIQRYWDKFQEGGFKKLVESGSVCSDARIEQLVQKSAPGMATLFTGTNPSTHGIISNEWYNRMKANTINCVKDEYFITLGSDSKEENCSASNLRAETIGDYLKKSFSLHSKVYSVALNNTSAVLSAGHAANGAFWLDITTGNMVTSSYYMGEFPNWIRDFNTKNMANEYMTREWTTLLPTSMYTESLADDYILEKGYYEKWNTFPYQLDKLKKRAESIKPLKTTPFGNTLVKDFALRLIEEEQLGKDENTDLLTVTFSSMDYENNSFGPNSIEMQDTYLRLDQEIMHLLRYLDKEIGTGNYLIFLTSNVSASYSPQFLKEDLRMPAGEFTPQSSIALLKSFLNITYGQGEWILEDTDNQIYLNHKLIEKNKINLDDIQNKAANFLNDFEGVKIAIPTHLLQKGGTFNGKMTSFINTYNYKRSGDILYMLEQGWWPKYKYKRTEYTANNHIPMIFFGSNIKPGTVNTKVSATDLVPTLCRILSLDLPDYTEGKLIQGITW
ncbi:alkaline phosphatase family protein [Puteibacter caeruleilacunae]|nr:alkaline phosphatase family protein [Puteibacter caeruleilacunae]